MEAKMAQWEGSWRFNNGMHPKHGSVGTNTVTASSEVEARQAVQDEASKALFGTTGMQTYVVVDSIKCNS